MVGRYLCGSMYYILNVQFSKIEICLNQILSSAFPFIFSLEKKKKSKGWIVEAEDTKPSRSAANQQVCLAALLMED